MVSRFLSIDEVAQRYGVSHATVWRWVKNNKHFLAPIKLSPGTSRWSNKVAIVVWLSGSSMSQKNCKGPARSIRAASSNSSEMVRKTAGTGNLQWLMRSAAPSGQHGYSASPSPPQHQMSAECGTTWSAIFTLASISGPTETLILLSGSRFVGIRSGHSREKETGWHQSETAPMDAIHLTFVGLSVIPGKVVPCDGQCDVVGCIQSAT